MAKIIAIANQKGGVGKTTTALSLAQAFAEAGKRTLLVDIDPQCNASDTLKAIDEDKPTMHDVMHGVCPTSNAVQHTDHKSGKLDCIQSDLHLASADSEFTQAFGREHILRKALSEVAAQYDFIIIDTPPSLGILTSNAVTAAHELIVPFGADRYSMQGMHQLRETIESAREYSNPNLRVAGILLTMDRPQTKLSKETKEILADVARAMGTKVFSMPIRYAEAAKQGAAEQQNVLEFAPNSTVAQDYRALAHELLGLQREQGRVR
jgi:chromosome partitioning protein